jgi:hypothetical protein
VQNKVINYRAMMLGMLGKPAPSFKRFRCVTPTWDNTARRTSGARIYVGSTPQLYEAWLTEVAMTTVNEFPPAERILFVNAWNEWAEGCHLEPDLKWNRQYLEATRAAMAVVSDAQHSQRELGVPSRSYPRARRMYWRARAFLAEQRDLLNNLFGRQG